jgi:uncharacterized membrane protein YfcA
MIDQRRSVTVKLAAVGTVAGLFSGLFGVGGGSVMVPLLILWLAYDQRTATGTSLAAIVLIAGVGTITGAIYGNLHAGDAALVGLPAVAGVLVGTSAQQRIATPTLSIVFAVLLAVVGVRLLVGA